MTKENPEAIAPLATPKRIYRIRGTDHFNDIWEITTTDRKRALKAFETFQRQGLRSPAIICGSALYEAHMLERLP